MFKSDQADLSHRPTTTDQTGRMVIAASLFPYYQVKCNVNNSSFTISVVFMRWPGGIILASMLEHGSAIV